MTSDQIELMAPAGNFEKLKFAVYYGADGVYFGGKEFNLRDQSTNLDADYIEQAVDFCRANNVKSTFLLNSFLHENDVYSAEKYISSIAHNKFDAIMISDPGMLSLIRKSGMMCRIHLSTQMSTLNHLSARFWKDNGVSRIVLARETTIDEMKRIKDNTDIEIEAFVHGALCISYSGRCLLSRFLSGRDANSGLCSHPCRWKFHLVEEKREGHLLEFIEHSKGTEILSSKDLCLINRIADLINAGVDALKIEGRMKSLYYAANVTRVYKNAVISFLQNSDSPAKIEIRERELDLVSHRPYTEDLFNEFGNMGFTPLPYIKKVLFSGYLTEDSNESTTYVKSFNPIYTGDKLNAILPDSSEIINEDVTVLEILENDRPTDMQRPSQICNIVFDKPLPPKTILRKILK